MPVPLIALGAAAAPAGKLVGGLLERLMGGGPERWSWRRMAVLATATWLFYGGRLSEENWMFVAVAFVGGDTLGRIAGTWRARRTAAAEAEAPPPARRPRGRRPLPEAADDDSHPADVLPVTASSTVDEADEVIEADPDPEEEDTDPGRPAGPRNGRRNEEQGARRLGRRRLRHS